MSDPNLPEGVTREDIDRIGDPFPLTEEPEKAYYEWIGNRVTCVRGDFVDSKTSPFGFGYTKKEALADLITKEEERK